MYQGRCNRGGDNLRGPGRAFQGEGTACAKPGDKSARAQPRKSECAHEPVSPR